MTVTPRGISVLAFTILLPVSVSAQSQDPSGVRPISLEHALASPRFQSLSGQAAALSPRGDRIAYAICDPKRVTLNPSVADQNDPAATAWANRAGCDVWLTDIDTSHSTNLTLGRGGNWAPSWSPDGNVLAFLSDRDGAPRIWLWDVRIGALRRLSQAEIMTASEAEAPIWAPNSRGILARLRTRDERNADPNRVAPLPNPLGNDSATARPASVAVLQADSQRVKDGPTSHENVRIVPDAVPSAWLGDLAWIDLATGQVRVIASRVRSIKYLLSPNGAQVGYLSATGRLLAGPDGAKSLAYVLDLVVADVASGRARTVASAIRQLGGASLSWSPDGKTLAYVSGSTTVPNTARSVYDFRGDLYTVPSSGGSAHRFEGAPVSEFDNGGLGPPPLWNATGSELYLIGTSGVWLANIASGRLARVPLPAAREPEAIVQVYDGKTAWSPSRTASICVVTHNSASGRSGIYRIDLPAGTATLLLEDDRSHGDIDLHPPVGTIDKRRIIYRAESATEAEDVWAGDVKLGRSLRLTQTSPHLGSYIFGRSRVINFLSALGQPLKGTLLLPAGFTEGRQYPLVVFVYPGAFGSAWANSFGIIGSSLNMQILATRGYAVLFPDIPVQFGAPIQDLMDAVMPAINRTIELGIADPDRLVLFGHSAGGYSVLSLLTRTTRFKAGIMSAGFGDLTGLYGTMTPSGAPRFAELLEGTPPWMGAPPWEVPLRYVQNSPIFYLDRVQTPMLLMVGVADPALAPLMDQVYVALTRLRRDVTYLRYDGEGHVLRRYPNLVDYWTRVLAFLDQHLQARQAVAPVPHTE